MFFFNNCKMFDHAKDYGITDAFFDVDTTGFQATQATRLSPGETCIVATKEEDGRIRFTWYSFLRGDEALQRHPLQSILWSGYEARDAVEGPCRSRWALLDLL